MHNDNFYFLHNKPLATSAGSSTGNKKTEAYTIKQGDLAVLLTEDIEKFSSAVGDIFSTLLKPVIQISAFSAVLYRLVGPFVAGIFLAYLGGGLALIRAFIPNFEKFTKREASLEVGSFAYFFALVLLHYVYGMPLTSLFYVFVCARRHFISAQGTFPICTFARQGACRIHCILLWR